MKMRYLCKLGKCEELRRVLGICSGAFMAFYRLILLFFDNYINSVWVHKLIASVTPKAFS